MELTFQQQLIIAQWKACGSRFLGFFKTDDNAVVICFTDKPIDRPDSPTGETFRIKYNAAGEEIAASYYPNVLTPNVSAV